MNTKSIIKATIISSIKSFVNRKIGKPNYHPLNHLIPFERNVRSLVGGLETAMGTTLWEPLAKSLAEENGFEVVEKQLKMPSPMPGFLSNVLQDLYEDRKSANPTYTAQASKEEIIRRCQRLKDNSLTSFIKPKSGSGVDIWIRKDGIDYFFDTKTVNPNVRSLTSFMEQVLSWYAYYFALEPEGNAEARIVFPYNPYHPRNFWSGTRGGGFPLVPGDESWVENEFWDFCSGETNTYALIIESFEEIQKEGELTSYFEKLFK